jgi:CelD/BcsL family acetyltransferase involved in cellulose biosynthesis
VIDEITTDDGFRALRHEWSELLDESCAPSVFLTWEWLYSWWRHVGGACRPAIITIRRNGRLEAIAPLATRPWDLRRLQLYRALGFLGAPLRTGNVGSDYLDVIVRRDSPEALRALGAFLSRRGRVLDLAQVEIASAAAARLGAALRDAGWAVTPQASGLCPVVDLAGHTWDSYLATRGREHRYSVQRKLRALHKNSAVDFHLATTEREREEALGILLDLHEKRWREKEGVPPSDAFHTPALRAFHETFTRLALEQGWLRLFVLRLDGVPAAALYGFRHGRTFSFYQSGFDPAEARRGVGVATMALSVAAAIAEGAEVYDLLHGEEEYKFHWANRTRPLVRLALYPPRAQGRLAAALATVHAQLRPVARRVLLHP